MPQWVKYGIAFALGVIVAKSPSTITSVAHGLQQFLAGFGHG